MLKILKKLWNIKEKQTKSFNVRKSVIEIFKKLKKHWNSMNVSNIQRRNASTDGSLMQHKRNFLAEKNGFFVIYGWVLFWWKYNSIIFRKIFENKKDANLASYSTENDFNADEIGLHFKILLKHTYPF